ncbi:MAG TPA: GNAT family N-acetyltransferase [Steroidobacter sp.]
MTSPRFIVRRAVPGDEPILRMLRLEALTNDPDAFSSTYERELARTTEDWQRWMSPGITLILEEGGEARGLVSGMYDAEQAAVVHLMAMWVHPDLRGSGAADALVIEHLKWAHSVRAKLVRLGVIATNIRARRFYERHGFRLTGRETIWEADGRVELQMERPVSSME